VAIRNKLLGVLLLSIVLFACHNRNSIEDINEFVFKDDFDILQLAPRDGYDKSYLVYNDASGKITSKYTLNSKDSISYGNLIQDRNEVYFSNNYIYNESIISYDYNSNKMVNKLDFTADNGRGYENMNPFSEYPIVIQNIGLADKIEEYTKSICLYLDNNWKCHENTNRLVYNNAIVHNGLIYAYLTDWQPNFDQDALYVYDVDFNLINQVNIYEKYGMDQGEMILYPSKSGLLLIGLTDYSSLTITKIDNNLNVLEKVNYEQTDGCLNAELSSYFKKDDYNIYIQMYCSTGNVENSLEVSNKLVLFNPEDISIKPSVYLLGNKDVAGINFKDNYLFLNDRTSRKEESNIAIYDLDFNYIKNITFERVRNSITRVVDINKKLIIN